MCIRLSHLVRLEFELLLQVADDVVEFFLLVFEALFDFVQIRDGRVFGAESVSELTNFVLKGKLSYANNNNNNSRGL